MPATVTLSTTTLSEPLERTGNEVKLATRAGVIVGTRLFVDGELLRVVSLLVDPWVFATRGADGTRGIAHPSGLTVYIGEGHQFYGDDPQGIPPDAIPVSPRINLRNGKVWFARGDTLPNGNAIRWWEEQTASHFVGPTGQQITTYDPTVST